MPVDPQVEAVMAPMAKLETPDIWNIEPAVLRALFTSVGPQAAPAEVSSVENRSVPGPAGEIPVRIYTPAGTGPFPLLVFFHGGGFVLCGLESHDALARLLCNGSGAIVVSVDYRLAPEHKFPAAPEDCYAATLWAAQSATSLGAHPVRIALAGDSAGGNLAAVVAQMTRARGGPEFVHQLLIYPVCEFNFDTASYADNAEAYLLSRDMMKWFWHHYLEKAEDGKSSMASPLLAKDLSGLAPATVITAEYDPLRDEGEAYAKRLEAAGVPVEFVRYAGMIHGFVSMSEALDKGREALDFGCARLRKAFAIRAATVS